MTPEVIKTLIEIANEQQRVMAAWRPSPVVPRKAILHTNPDLTNPAVRDSAMEANNIRIFRSDMVNTRFVMF